MKLTNINPDTGEMYDYNLWTSTLNHNPDPVTKSWREAMGVMTAKEYFVKNNMIEVSKPYSWKMVFAKKDAQYNKLKEEMITKSKGLGYDEAIAFEVGNAEKMSRTG
ncbi:hypothetical protein [Paenibacillus wynnii]|uniref:Uncharacterized protein n=1 Tax=Paenibacillus wynnii TaxID=268407 RepID=A0A098M8D1_9BACL|nr:hypothetical protein [Paenibacillus wynnii]KGE18805.1 hypothetical protein PWYN_05045 [Paenibacillus wynnii]